MQIIDLADEYAQLYFVCLEDWSEEMKEAGDHKQVRTGPPPSYDKIKKTIAKRARKL